MSRFREDEELPAPAPAPRLREVDDPPSTSEGGWFEVFCCGTLVVLLLGGLILVAVLTR